MTTKGAPTSAALKAMRSCLIITIAFISVSAHAQMMSRNQPRRLPMPRSSCSTNEFGRTFAEQREYDAFLSKNPSGKNRFGRTFEEDKAFTSSITIPTFLGFTFGENLTGEKTQILEKPFRMFSEVSLTGSALNRIVGINMTQKTKDLSKMSISNETSNLIGLLENEYKVAFDIGDWDSNWVGVEGFSAKFKNTNVAITVSCSYSKRTGEGDLSLEVLNTAMSKFDKEEKERRELKAVEGRQKSVVLDRNEGADMISASKPSAKPKTRGATATNTLLDRRLRRGDAEADLLEPILTIDEAVKLAKANEPRGYYQLAINISKNRSWTDKTFDAQKHIDYCLQEAADAGYLNAIFLQNLIRDRELGYPTYSDNSSNGISPTRLMDKYCGFELSSWRHEGSLTNDSDVAEIVSVYQCLEDKGIKQAAEARIGLQERVKYVKAKLAERKERESAHDKMADLVRSVVKLPEEEKSNIQTSTIHDAAKKEGRVYIKTTGDEAAKTGWSRGDQKPLTIEFYDANEGQTREFRFSADGRLILVSPVQ